MAEIVKNASWRHTARAIDDGDMPITAVRPTLSPVALSGAAAMTRPGPVVRVIAGSLATGLVAAGALTLVVVPGAPEYVVTGTGLLGFAVGWAMLAVLSVRLTAYPLRWASVPAAVMAAVGSALLVFEPADRGLTVTSWVWPVMAVGLALWMIVRARRSLPPRARRWLLYPLLAVWVVTAFGGGSQTVQDELGRRGHPMPGRAYDVGGRSLHLNCSGTGHPTVVLLGGLGESSPTWAHVIDGAGGTGSRTRVCGYDRAGQGWSEDGPRPQDGVMVADDLHTLLARAGESGPFVLAGHSTGGAYAMVYASRYPGEVAGLVLLDSASPDQFTALPEYPGFYAAARRVFPLLPPLYRAGLGQLVNATAGSTLLDPARGQLHFFATSPRDRRSQSAELSTFPDVFRQAQDLTTLDGKPLLVVTAAEGQQPGWAVAQDGLVRLSSNSGHRTVPATHATLLLDRDDAAFAIDAINEVVQSARTRGPVR